MQTRATRSDGPPPRPDAATSATRNARRWLPAIVVLLVIVTVVMGGYVVAGALSEPAGPPVGFAGVVSVRPLSGWQFAGRDRVGGAPFVRITRGNGNLDVVAVVPFDRNVDALATEYAQRILSAELSQLSVSPHPESVRLLSGLHALRYGYVGVVADTGASIEGEVTVLVTAGGHGVVFDGWAPEGLLSFVRSDIETMVERAAVL